MVRPVLVPDSVPAELNAPESGDTSELISPEPQSPQPAGSSTNSEARKNSRVLVVVLAIALLATGLALVEQSRRAALLESEIVVLEAEVTAAASAVEAYQIRFEQVRGEVGALVSRVGALRSLVEPDVVPAGLSGSESVVAPEPASRD